MNIYYIIILILIVIFIILFKYIEPMIAKKKIKNNNEHGSARFATVQEIKLTFKKENLNRINDIGFPILFDRKLNNVWIDKETPHWVYLGSTGSGKSVTQVIPYCAFLSSAKNKRSAFITDPKGEIFNATSKMFKDRGYNVITIDFRHPELSDKLNILESIIKEYEKYIEYEKKSNKAKKKNEKIEYNNISLSSYAEANRLITSLSEMIMKDKFEAKDPFWNNSARQLLEGLIGFFLEEYKLGNIKREQITLTSIRKFQNSSMNDKNFKKFVSYLETKEYGCKSKDSLTSVITASENTYKSITSVWGSKMSIFDDVNVANVTSCSDFEFDILGKEPTVLYAIVPDEDKTYFTLVTIIVGLLYRELVKLANNQIDKKLPVQIDWILDEFANCPPLSDIEAIVSVARSRGMRFHFFIQSFAQLDNVYGKEVAQIILDNCGLVYLKTNTQDTAEAISKRLGKKTIEANSISQSTSINRYDANQSVSLMARDLLTPDEIKQLHYKMIIFPIIGYPIFRDTIIYQKFSCYKKGVIERNVKYIKDLSNTYYTVENIKHEINQEAKERNKLTSKIMKDKIEIDKEKFEKIINYTKNKFGEEHCNFSFEERNYQIYLHIEIDHKIINKDLIDMKMQFSKKFHFEYSYVSPDQIINVHLLSLF